jgi:hypothetical protein
MTEVEGFRNREKIAFYRDVPEQLMLDWKSGFG